jgi:hypothetical protein
MFPIQFAGVDLPTFSPSRCSPEAPDDYRGLLIAAPKSVTLGEAIPVCGTFRLGAEAVNKHLALPCEVTLVAIDMESYEARSGNLAGDGRPERSAPLDPTMRGFDKYVMTGWFNADLVEVLELPRKKAKYRVFAALGDWVSNMAIIEVTP